MAPLGVGLGYRADLDAGIRANLGEIDFLEIVGDHCFQPAARERIVEWSGTLPTVCHFLGLSLGTADELDETYVAALEKVLAEIKPRWFSDHLALTRVRDVDLGHLAPVLPTDDTVEIVARKAATVQARCGLPFLLENITHYVTLPGATMTEAQLLTQIVEAADCGILLDLTNLYVNSHNHRYDPYEFLRSIPLERVLQVHIGGATMRDGVAIDSHAHPVPDVVFDYLEHLCRHSAVAAVLLERDRNMPDFAELTGEMQRAREILRRAHVKPSATAGS